MEVNKLATVLNSKIIKKSNVINVQFKREDFEKFCNALGLYKKEFINSLKKSENDYKEGRIKGRKSLYELVKR